LLSSSSDSIHRKFIPYFPTGRTAEGPLIMPSHAACSYPQIDLLPEQGVATDEIRTQVWGLLSTLFPKTPVLERRRETRYPFPCLVYLTPVAADGETACGENVVVVGKHVSERGLSFYHPKPLPYRRMIASLEGPHGVWFAFLIDLSWCRFTRQGWYESGGRFLESVASPLEK
jgi:hypothetical protein